MINSIDNSTAAWEYAEKIMKQFPYNLVDFSQDELLELVELHDEVGRLGTVVEDEFNFHLDMHNHSELCLSKGSE